MVSFILQIYHGLFQLCGFSVKAYRREWFRRIPSVTVSSILIHRNISPSDRNLFMAHLFIDHERANSVTDRWI